MAQADEFLVTDGRAPDDVRHAPGQANAVREQGRTGVEAIALPDHRVDGEARPIKLIFKAISDAGAVFEPIIAREAIQGEKIAVLQFHRARILIGHAEIGELRRCDDLHSWRDLLRAAKGLSDKRPAHVYCRRRDAEGLDRKSTRMNYSHYCAYR